MRRRVVAIDGPVGVGKSSVAREVARRLGIPFLETGAMYRALGLRVVEEGLDPGDAPAVEALAEATEIDLERGPDGRFRVLVDGRTVSAERIREADVSEATSRISAYPRVRRRLVDLQRRCVGPEGAVLEGRDIGSRVFPETPFKFYLDASPEVRVERRLRQLREAGRDDVPRASVEEDVRSRDRRDSTRSESPLIVDDTYTVVDTDDLDREGVVEAIVRRVEEAPR